MHKERIAAARARIQQASEPMWLKQCSKEEEEEEEQYQPQVVTRPKVPVALIRALSTREIPTFPASPVPRSSSVPHSASRSKLTLPLFPPLVEKSIPVIPPESSIPAPPLQQAVIEKEQPAEEEEQSKILKEHHGEPVIAASTVAPQNKKTLLNAFIGTIGEGVVRSTTAIAAVNLPTGWIAAALGVDSDITEEQTEEEIPMKAYAMLPASYSDEQPIVAPLPAAPPAAPSMVPTMPPASSSSEESVLLMPRLSSHSAPKKKVLFDAVFDNLGASDDNGSLSLSDSEELEVSLSGSEELEVSSSGSEESSDQFQTFDVPPQQQAGSFASNLLVVVVVVVFCGGRKVLLDVQIKINKNPTENFVGLAA